MGVDEHGAEVEEWDYLNRCEIPRVSVSGLVHVLLLECERAHAYPTL